MIWQRIGSIFYCSILFAILSLPVSTGRIYLPHRYFAYSPLTIQSTFHLPKSRRSRNLSEDLAETLLVSKSQIAKNVRRRKELNEEKWQPNNEFRNLSYNDLGPIGKIVAGCTEILFATGFDYCSGYLQGLICGTLFGSPGFIFRPVTKGVRQPFMTEISSRLSRMNTRSMSWAKNFGSISAAFGGFGVAAKVLRNGEQDMWNDIFSSAAAGAFFGRKDGPRAMLRGALLYGGLIYITSSSKNSKIQEYTEKPAIEF